MGFEGFRVAGAGAGITSWRIGLLIWMFHTYSTVRNQQSRLWGRFWRRTVSIPRPLLPMSTIRWGRECSPGMYIKKSSKCQKKKHFSVPIVCISICANQGHLALWFWLRLSVKERAGNAWTKSKAAYTSQPNISQKLWFNFSQPAHPFLSQ